MPFEIIVLDEENLVEVVYPARPTREDVDDYARRMREVITSRRPGWKCLVDQTQLQLLPPELVGALAELNELAQRHHMARTARIVISAIAGLQAQRIAREGNLTSPLRTFDNRDAALQWLTPPSGQPQSL